MIDCVPALLASGGNPLDHVLDKESALSGVLGIEKLKLNTRVEYFDNGSAALAALGGAASAGRGRANVAGVGAAEVLAATITADYQLWKNVISRLEYRWDHDASGGKHLPGNVNSGGLGGAGNNNAHLVALNLIYKF